jgi:hypothetical protein
LKTKIFFKFLIGHYDDTALDLQISVDGRSKTKFNNLLIDELTFTLCVDLPCRIEFQINGKSADHTVVDDRGQIIKDTYIELKKIILDSLEIDAWDLPESHLIFQTDSGIGCKNFWGRNGTATLNIDEDDPVIWVLNHKSLILNTRSVPR